jgi:predicted metal-dependent phosphoesterase TrpH
MIPPLIIEKALEEKIDIIALTDHNTAANVPAMLDAAVGTGITVFPGMELETSEEIHVLCLFDTLAQLQTFEKIVNSHLPDYKNNDEFFGYQLGRGQRWRQFHP